MSVAPSAAADAGAAKEADATAERRIRARRPTPNALPTAPRGGSTPLPKHTHPPHAPHHPEGRALRPQSRTQKLPKSPPRRQTQTRNAGTMAGAGAAAAQESPATRPHQNGRKHAQKSTQISTAREMPSPPCTRALRTSTRKTRPRGEKRRNEHASAPSIPDGSGVTGGAARCSRRQEGTPDPPPRPRRPPPVGPRHLDPRQPPRGNPPFRPSKSPRHFQV